MPDLGEEVVVGRKLQDCPFCKDAHMCTEKKMWQQSLVCGVRVECWWHFIECERTKEAYFVTAKMMDENCDRAREAYKKWEGSL